MNSTTEKSQLVGVGYITAVVVPIVGFVVGIILATKAGRPARHGVAVMLIAVLTCGVWAAVAIHAAQTSAPVCHWSAFYQMCL